MDPEDPEQVIAFLCGKFSGLIDKVQNAEARQLEAQQMSSALEEKVRAAVAMRHNASSSLRAALQLERDRAAAVRVHVQDAHACARRASEDLVRTCEAASSLEEQCENLHARCEAERLTAAQAADVAAQGDEARAACASELERLRGEASKLAAEVATVEGALDMGRVCEKHRLSDARLAEERLAEAGRARRMSEQRSAALSEELAITFQQLPALRDRLEDAKREQQVRHDAIQDEDERLSGLRVENHRRERELVQLGDGLVEFRAVKVDLEAMLAQREEASIRHRASQRQAESCWEAVRGGATRGEEAEKALSAGVGRLHAIQAENARQRENLHSLEVSIAKVHAEQKLLEEESNKLCNTSMQTAALQQAFAEAEQLRSERQDIEASCGELHRKLRNAEPALEAARRRCRELEMLVQEAEAEIGRARSGKDDMMREVNKGRERMRGLRKRHEQLVEQAQGLERRLLRSSGSFGGTAVFAACAAPTSVAQSYSVGGAGAVSPRTPVGQVTTFSPTTGSAGVQSACRTSPMQSVPELPLQRDFASALYVPAPVAAALPWVGTAEASWSRNEGSAKLDGLRQWINMQEVQARHYAADPLCRTGPSASVPSEPIELLPSMCALPSACLSETLADTLPRVAPRAELLAGPLRRLASVTDPLAAMLPREGRVAVAAPALWNLPVSTELMDSEQHREAPTASVYASAAMLQSRVSHSSGSEAPPSGAAVADFQWPAAVGAREPAPTATVSQLPQRSGFITGGGDCGSKPEAFQVERQLNPSSPPRRVPMPSSAPRQLVTVPATTEATSAATPVAAATVAAGRSNSCPESRADGSGDGNDGEARDGQGCNGCRGIGNAIVNG